MIDPARPAGGGSAAVAGRRPPARDLDPGGLSEAEAQRRLTAAGRSRRAATSRSYASIVRANVLTVFNLILAVFGTLTLIFGDARDALFLGVIVANSTIGIVQEVRAKRALDRLALLVAPSAKVLRDGRARPLPPEQLVVGDVVIVQPGDQLVADGTVVSATELRLDESVLTGESEPAGHVVGDAILSGASTPSCRGRSSSRERAPIRSPPQVSRVLRHG